MQQRPLPAPAHSAAPGSGRAAPDRAAARARARTAWRALADRLATVTPAAAARAALTSMVLLAAAWLVVASWPALMPFLVGGVIAYAVKPIVDVLDMVLPRVVAALFAVLVTVGVLAAIVVIVGPPLVEGFARLVATLPGAGDVQSALGELESVVGPLPAEAHDILAAVVLSAVGGIGGLVGGVTQADLPTLADEIVGAIVSVASQVIGLIVLPTWVLTLVAQGKGAHDALDRRMARWLRADAWAVLRILDRVASTYLRGYLSIALLVGVFTYIGLQIVERTGLVGTFQQELPLAVFAGAVQVIPELGPWLGYLPVLLILIVAPDRALAYLATYIAARWIVNTFFGGRLIEGRLHLHPILLVPGLVALTQFGIGWLFIAGPVLATLWDLVRYFHGRFSEPPRPAGVIPGEPLPESTTVAVAASRSPTRRVPSVYRSRATAIAAQGRVTTHGR